MPLAPPRVARCLSTDYVADPERMATHFLLGLCQDGWECAVAPDPIIPCAFRLTLSVDVLPHVGRAGDYAIFRPEA